MIAEEFGTISNTVVSGYESLFDTFGSPYVLIAISVALIAAATVELYLRRRRKDTEVA